MNRVLKILFGLGLTVVVLLGGIAAYFKFFFDPNDLREKIAQTVESETGRQFAIEGDLSLTVFPWLGFEVGRTRLGEDPAFGDGDFLSFDNASARVKLMPLLSKRVEIDKLTVSGLDVRLLRNASGKDNWASLAGEAGTDTPAPEPAQAGGTTFSTERIGAVVVENAHILLDDRQAGTTTEIKALNARTGSIRPGEPVSLEAGFTLVSSAQDLTADVTFAGTGRLEGEDILIEAPALTVAGADQNLADGVAVSRFELTVRAPALRASEARVEAADPEIGLRAAGEAVGGDLTLALTARSLTLGLADERIAVPAPKLRVELAGKGALTRVDGEFSAEGLNYSTADGRGTLTGPSLRAALAGESLPKDLRVELDAKAAEIGDGGKTLALKEYKLAALDVVARGTAAVDMSGDKAVVTGPVDVAPFSLRKLLARLDVPVESADKNVLTKVSAKGQLRASADAVALSAMTVKLDESTLTGRFAVSNFDQPAHAFDLTVDVIDVDRYLAPSAAPADGEAGSAADAIELPVETLRKLTLNGTLKVGALKVAGLETRDVTVGLDAGGGRLRVHPSAAKLYGGTYSGDIRLDASGATPVINLNETVTGIDFAAFASTVMPRNPLTGKLNGNVLLSARGTNTAQMQSTLNGTTRFDFEDGVIQNVDLWHNVRSVIALADRSSPPAATGPRQTRFEKLTGSARVTDGVIVTETLAANVPHLDVDGSGRVNLNDRSIDFRVQARVVEEEGAELLPRERKLVGFRVPVYIGGTIDAPVVQKDKSVGDVVAQLAKRKLADKLGLLKKDEPEPEPGAEPGQEQPASQDDVDQSLDEKKEDLKDQLDRKAKDLLKDLIG